MRTIILLSRGLYLALILWAVGLGELGVAAFNSVLFFGSGFLAWRGWHNREYAVLDALVSLTFASTIFISLQLSWMTGLFGFDKLYHLLGGMCLGWFASLVLRDLKGWQYPAAIILTAAVLGIAWEGFEWVFSVLPPPLTVPFSPYGFADSARDVIADTLGGIIVAIVRRRR